MPSNIRRRQDVSIRLPDWLGPQFRADVRAAIEGLVEENGFKAAYLRDEIFSKYVDPTTTSASDRRSAAISKWLGQEQLNQTTNMRLQLADDSIDFGWCTWGSFKATVRQFVARVLGPVVYPAVIQQGIHTNGASRGVRRGPSAAIQKLSGDVLLSESAVKHWLAAWSGTMLSSQQMALEERSELFTVPKKSDIDRVACKEPEGNMLLQRSVGIYIRNRLRNVGIDLRDQTRNQNLARIAWGEGLATVDLSSASDSITRQLVFEFLPFDWWSLLDDLRVKSAIVDDHEHELEMFSSMGNGFTFELESLLFWAITRTVCKLSGTRRHPIKGRISVYGDDIIMPSTVVRRQRRLFSFLGFKMNPKKTHWGSKDPFRESCGKHYYRGFDVTPFYIRREVQTLPDLINHLNHLLEWSGRGWGGFLDQELYILWLKWMKFVPKKLWGGIDPSDPSALVTGDSPQKHLVPRTREVGFDQHAGYIHWHMSAQTEPREAFSCDPRIDIGYKVKPVISRGERTSWMPGAFTGFRLTHL
ncbi:TPA_asm: RNA-directed RNA polymerase [ssRNA phage SRR6960509_5]|uniref:RNA-directed RNA polymerase n=1 Tax=ssRNA phage SRR6960509_5 TaxID=2786532 RepID=A0A8S5KZ42_9VIRU|nr:RNA-directed RNA polymerase [ssRNA phage SRR6960509_5]DAD50998.1 TPA_asm: RNA-directed RNA polymerase [ssRNA phage SRR6960509_5]